MTGHVTLQLERSSGFGVSADFDVPDNGTTVLFGPSGSGKTTVLRAVAGLERAAGRVELAGHVWQDDARNVWVPTYSRRLGYVFQESSLFPHLTVRENLLFGVRRQGVSLDEKEFRDAVALLGIEGLLGRRPHQLSGGERQRCAMARALVTKPHVLLMDEPMASLDRARRMEILPWIETLRRELAIPVIYITHNEDELLRLADTVVCLESGRVAAIGDVREIFMSAAGAGYLSDRACVRDAVIAEKDGAGLMKVISGGLSLWVSDDGRDQGSVVRVCVKAADVALSLSSVSDSSAENILPVCVTELMRSDGGRHGQGYLVRLAARDDTVLFARVSERQKQRLHLHPGMPVFACVRAAGLAC